MKSKLSNKNNLKTRNKMLEAEIILLEEECLRLKQLHTNYVNMKLPSRYSRIVNKLKKLYKQAFLVLLLPLIGCGTTGTNLATWLNPALINPAQLDPTIANAELLRTAAINVITRFILITKSNPQAPMEDKAIVTTLERSFTNNLSHLDSALIVYKSKPSDFNLRYLMDSIQAVESDKQLAEGSIKGSIDNRKFGSPMAPPEPIKQTQDPFVFNLLQQIKSQLEIQNRMTAALLQKQGITNIAPTAPPPPQ